MAAINITPLVDVLLIVVVMLLLVVPTLAKRLPIALPRTSTAGSQQAQRALVVMVDREGILALNGAVISLNSLIERVEPGLTTVDLAPAATVSYGTLTSVIEALRRRNVKEIVLLTR